MKFGAVWGRMPHEEHEDMEYCTDPELIDEKFGDLVDLVIDGGIGGTESSTIVDLSLIHI